MLLGLPRWHSGKESTYQGTRRNRQASIPVSNLSMLFHPCLQGVRKIPWSRKWQTTPVFLRGKFHGERGAWWTTVHRVAKSQTWLSDWACTHNSLLVQVFEDSLIDLHPCFSKCGPQVQNIIIIWELLKRQVIGSSIPHIPVESETQHFINPPGNSDAC